MQQMFAVGRAAMLPGTPLLFSQPHSQMTCWGYDATLMLFITSVMPIPDWQPPVNSRSGVSQETEAYDPPSRVVEERQYTFCLEV
jgi:hypothetical protein